MRLHIVFIKIAEELSEGKSTPPPSLVFAFFPLCGRGAIATGESVEGESVEGEGKSWKESTRRARERRARERDKSFKYFILGFCK